MNETVWLRCPVCGNKTRLKVRHDTELINFPLYCPKCKQETLINVKKTNLSVIKANTQIPKENIELWWTNKKFTHALRWTGPVKTDNRQNTPWCRKLKVLHQGVLSWAKEAIRTRKYYCQRSERWWKQERHSAKLRNILAFEAKKWCANCLSEKEKRKQRLQQALYGITLCGLFEVYVMTVYIMRSLLTEA